MAAAGDEMENEATSALAIAADSAAAESTEGNVDATAQPQKVESSFKKLVNYHKRVEYFTACSRATEYAADALDGTTAVEFLKAHNKLGPKGKLTQLKGLSEAYQASLESEYKTESEREAAKAVVSFSVVDKNVGITRKVFHCWSALHANEPPTDNIEAMWTWALEETGGLDSRRAFEALISLCREGTAAGSISTRFLKHYQERQRRALETAAERFAHSDNRSDERSAASDRSESMSVSDELDEPPTAAADSTGHVGDNEDHNSSTLDDETSVAVGEGAPPAVGEEVAPPAARPAASGRGGDGGNRLPSSQANKPPSDPGLGPNEPDPTTEANEGDAPLAGITHPPGDTGERGDRFASGQTNKSSEANPSGSTTVEEGVGAPPDAAAAVLARDGGDGGARNAASQGNNPPGEEPVVPALANIEPAVATPTQGSGSNRTRSASVADDEGAPPEGPTDRSGRGREGGDRRGTSQANKSSEAHPSGLTSVEGEVVATPVGTTDPPGDSGERGDRFASSQTNKSSEANPPGSTSVEEGAGALQEAAAAVPARDGGEGGARNPASQGNNPSVEESVVRQLANMETPALSRRQGLRSSRSRSKSESVAEGAGPDASAAPPRDRDSVEGGDPNTSSQANKHPGEQQEVREQAANETTPTQGLGSNRSRSTSESVEAATAAQARESDSEGGEDPRQPSKPSGLRGSSRFVSPPPHLANVETPDSSEGVATRSKKRGSSAIATEPVKRRRAATESPMAASADTCDEHTVQGRVPNPSAPRKSRPPTHQESPSPSQPAHSRRSSPRKLGSHVGTNRGTKAEELVEKSLVRRLSN